MGAKGKPFTTCVDGDTGDLLLTDAEGVDRVEVGHLPQAENAVGEADNEKRALLMEAGTDGLGAVCIK